MRQPSQPLRCRSWNSIPRPILSVLLVVAWLGSHSLQPLQAGSILREVFRGIPGATLADLTNNPAYPDHPSQTNLVSNLFESPSNFDDNYGQRMHGYIVPPVTGDYTFWIATDDAGGLFLSTNDDPLNAQLVASVNGWTSPRVWTTEANQMSDPIHLEAGKNYYISALQKEGGGGDNLAVRWLRPDGVDQGPIPATYLLPYGTPIAAPVISGQPTNTVAVEGQSAAFTVQLRNTDLTSIQWSRNGTPITGATSKTLTLFPVSLDDKGARFSATVWNALGTNVSSEAVLDVTPDVTAPQVVNAGSQGLAAVQVIFNEALNPASASTPSNFKITPDVAVIAARPGTDPSMVILTTAPLTPGVVYTVTLNGIQDAARTPNTLAAGTTVSFQALELFGQAIGPAPGILQRVGTGAFNLTGGIGDIGIVSTSGGSSDRFQFAWEKRTGNFDIQVRIADLGVLDPFTRAGLMVRTDVTTNAAFAGVFAGSAQVGASFLSRASTGAATISSGRFPVNFPQSWLRLRRSGTTLTGFASLDGVGWYTLGTTTLTLPNPVYLGLSVSSAVSNQPTSAQFRDYGSTTSFGTATLPTDREPIGPTSRHTGLVFSEILYRPLPSAGVTNNLEFVEITNADSLYEDLSHWTLNGGIDFEFPPGTLLPASGILVVAKDPDAIRQVYGITNVVGPFTGSLNNSGDTLRLSDTFGATKLKMTYSSKAPWPAAAAGAGHSLVLTRASYGEADPRAWGPSELVGGSPGRLDAVLPFAQRGLVLNEFLATPKDPTAGFIELFNPTGNSLDLTGCRITDDPQAIGFQIPAGTSIAPHGYLKFPTSQLGFSPNPNGGSLFVLTGDGTRAIDAVSYDDQGIDVAYGRSPDGAPTFRRLTTPTPGAPNAPWRVEDVVINEIMYAPISGDPDDQYIELFNPSAKAVDLEGWRFVDGIDFKIPSGTTLPAGGYLVVARNRSRLLANYPNLNLNNTVGGFNKSIPNGGRLALAGSDLFTFTNAVGDLQTQVLHPVVSEVTFVSGGRWGKYANGGGSSLELIDSHADLLRPSSWADSDETAKAPWTQFSSTNFLDNANSGGNVLMNRLYVLMQGLGECLVDDISVSRLGGTNLLTNGGFESGATGWLLSGDHSLSVLESGGAATGANALHLRAQGHGDTGPNSIRASMVSSLPNNSTNVLALSARWLAGWPEVLVRVRGGGIEMPVRLTVPNNLGTPGLPNSRRVDNSGPAIFDVTHTPVLPKAGEPVVISCRVSDSDGISRVVARYRTDPGTTTTDLVLRDDGTSGDLVAGDGIYSGTLSGRSSGTLIGFRIFATDAASAPAINQFPSTSLLPVGSPYSEAYIRWDDVQPSGSIAHYHLWSTSSTESKRTAALNNTYRDATLVYGNVRAMYNVGFRDKGSPFHQGAGSFALSGPDDEPLLGTTDRVFRSTGNGGQEETGLRNTLSAWLGQKLKIPFLHSHYMQLYRNGGQFYNLTQDEESPSGSFAKSWFPNSGEGDLYKIAVWFEFEDNNLSFNSVSSTIENFKDPKGNQKLARYRWNWQTRTLGGTANNYTNIFNLANLANDTSTNFVPNITAAVDLDEWMRILVYDRLLANWDSWTFNVGQNMYILKPDSGPWVLMPWDIDFTFGLGNGATDGLINGGQDPIMNQWFNVPAIRRVMWRVYREAINGPFLPENFQPVIDARRNYLLRNGVSGLSAPTPVTAFINQRRNFIQSQLQSADPAQFAITTNGGADFNSSTATATLKGTAPFAVVNIAVNDAVFPVTWTDQGSFSISIPLTAAVNPIRLTGLDRDGNAIPGFAAKLTISYAGAIPQAKDFVVINEIHYNPIEPGASFVELYNRSTATAFDLSGMRFQGLGFFIPDGTLIPAGGYAVFVKDRNAFAAAYGSTIPVAGEFGGSLDNNGEHLKLIVPAGLGGTNDLVVTDVRYSNLLPWPTNANGFGPSLQLIDPAQGSWRAANWTTTLTNSTARVTPGRANSVRATLQRFPTLWINEVLPENIGGPADGAGEHDPYIELYNSGTTAVSLDGLYLSNDYTDLNRWPFPAGKTLGAGQYLVVWADNQPAQSSATEYHANFRLAPGTGSVALARQSDVSAVLDYLDYRELPAGRSFGSIPDGEPRVRRSLFHPTAAAPNDPAFPKVQVFINELMASNTQTLVDPATGKFEDWFELYNSGTNSVDLTGYSLTRDITDPGQFTVPPGFVLPPGSFLLVWADKTSKSNTIPATELHTNFKLSKTGGQLALFGPDSLLVDSVNWEVQTNDVSIGRIPDGADGPLTPLQPPSPAAANTIIGGNRPPVVPSIPPQTVGEQTLLQWTVIASDPDAGQTLTYGLGAGAPAGAAIDAATGVFTWTPTEEQGPGNYVIPITVADNGTPRRVTTLRVIVAVQEVNQPPLLDPIPDRSIDEGTLYTFTATATDPDKPANTLTFSLDAGAPAGAAIDPVSGQFTWTPTEAQGPGGYTLTVRVRDNGTPAKEDSRSFTLAVREVNNPPLFAQVGPQTVNEGETLHIALTATDPDTPPSTIRYSLEGNLPDGITVDPDSGVITWIPTESQGPGTYVVIARATENNADRLSSVQSFGIAVNEVNQAPVLGMLNDLTVEEGATVAFTATATDADLPAQRLAFSLGAGAPAGASIDANTGAFLWQTPADSGATTNSISIQVTDNGPGALSQSRAFRVITRARFRAVINEIHYHPTVTGAGFIELYNPSSITAQSLAGLHLSGATLDYVFPAGTTLKPGQFLVIAENKTVFQATYGTGIPVLGNWTGSLDRNGTRLGIYDTSGTGSPRALTELGFRAALPWPAAADAGAALQLIDATRDSSRVGNWAAGGNASGTTWQRSVVTGKATSSVLYIYLENIGEAFIDDIRLVAGSDPDAGDNLLSNGDFETAFPGAWSVSDNLKGSSVTNNPIHAGKSALHLVSTAAGTTRASSVFQDLSASRPLTTDAVYTLSFWYLPNPAGGKLTLRLSGAPGSAAPILSSVDLKPATTPVARWTPGAANSLAAALPEFPPVWINEVMSDNVTGISDIRGRHGPWIELANTGATPIALDGWFLSNAYTNLPAWTFPAGTVVSPGQFLVVFADGNPADSSAAELHTNFRLSSGQGSVALSRTQLGAPAVVDYLDYSGTSADRSFGRDPLDFPFAAGLLTSATPGGANGIITSNHRPTLNHLADRVVAAGTPVDLQFTATDPDSAQTLTFSLLTPIAGATLDPVTGHFHWTPTPAQVGLVSVRVQVTDDGAPPMSDTTTVQLQVSVSDAFALEARSIAPNRIEIRWSAEAGSRYRVEIRDTVTSAWTLLTEVTATSSTGVFQETVPAGPARFYRIVLP